MPHTRWCRCSPELVSTLPGHHDTCARIIRALVRMKRNETRKASRTRKAASRPGSEEADVNGSTEKNARTPRARRRS